MSNIPSESVEAWKINQWKETKIGWVLNKRCVKSVFFAKSITNRAVKLEITEGSPQNSRRGHDGDESLARREA